MIDINHVSYQIGDHKLLDAIQLQLSPGRVYALLGPNGSGKSTLMRLIAGELHPSEGSISIDNTDLRDWSRQAIAQCRAILPQHSALNFDYTVDEVVALGRTPYSQAADEATVGPRAISAALDCLELGALRQRNYTTLSGGEQQRVQLARVLAQINGAPAAQQSTPRYLLLDEPTAGLDLSHQHALLQLARQLAGANTAVLISMHDPNHAAAYADDVIVLKEGQLVACGTTHTTLTAALLDEHFGIQSQSIAGPDQRSYFVFNAKHSIHHKS